MKTAPESIRLHLEPTTINTVMGDYYLDIEAMALLNTRLLGCDASQNSGRARVET